MVLALTFRRVRSLVRQRGIWGASQRMLEVLLRRLAPARLPAHPFDREHGVETGGLLPARKIRSGHQHDAQSTAYFGSQPSVVRAGVERWLAEAQAAGQAQQEFVFVDIGCGKGRVLMLASEFPFRQVIGLELSPALVSAAQQNLRRWASRPHLCREISVLQRDVLDFPLPDGPTLLYMYHPFEEELFQRWAESLRSWLSRRAAPLYLLYANPYFEDKLLALPQAHLLWSAYAEFTPDEIAAHHFGGISERVSLYRLENPSTRASELASRA